MNNEIPEAFLSTILQRKEAFVKAIDKIKVKDLVGIYKQIYTCLISYYSLHDKPDLSLLLNVVPDELKPTIIELYTGIVVESLLDEYMSIIKEDSDSRKLIALSDNIKNHINNGVKSTNVMNGIQAVISDLTNSNKNSIKSSRELARGSSERFKLIREGKFKSTNLMTGFGQLDRITGGLEKGCLYVLVAKTSLGKSALAINIAKNIAKNDRVVFYSLEMTSEQLFNRLIVNEAKEPIKYLPEKVEKIDDIMGKLSKLNLDINDQPYLSSSEIYMKTSVLSNVKFIVVDYLHLMNLENSETQALRIGNTTKSLKMMAKKLKIPILLLGQFNRNIVLRGGQEPMLSDIKDSSSIEQDADTVLLMYKQDKQSSNVTIKVAKNRGGAVGSFVMEFNPTIMEFTDV